MGYSTIYPTGATLYNPEKAWSGYTIFPVEGVGTILIDMNGKEVQHWKGLRGFPSKLLPGGYVIGSTGERDPRYGLQDMLDLVQVDWDGQVVWRFNENEFIEDPGYPGRWLARQHHDYQRAGNSVGYYTPEQIPSIDEGNTLILCHANVINKKISEKVLLDDKIIEVDWQGNIIWEWKANEHFSELGFDEAAKNVLARDPNIRPVGDEGVGDWLHINSMSTLGPNKWYDAGDERFHPDNIIWDAREANIIAIIDKKTGQIVWRLGPDYTEHKKLGWIIGQHHAHMIPRGLPGEGNILIFDNGGWAGYGLPNPSSPTGRQNARRDYSRILEIDPLTLDIVWQYTPDDAGFVFPVDSYRFYSPFVSSAQRLPNGNTLITEGSDGRLFEVTVDHEIVWEYINPYEGSESFNLNMIYRAYRVPYDWVPQLELPEEKSIAKTINKYYRVPDAAEIGAWREVEVEGAEEYKDKSDGALCVLSSIDE